MEFWIIGRMLKEGLDIYIPLVDDMAIDAVVRRKDGTFVEVQIKARSKDVVKGDAAFFAAIPHEARPNYWFIFYSERLDSTWIMNSEEFVAAAVLIKKGKSAGLRNIDFNGTRRNRETGAVEEYIFPKFQKHLATDFKKITDIIGTH